MQIAVQASPQQKQAFLSKGIPADVQLSWFDEQQAFAHCDACFDLLYEDNGRSVFANAGNLPVFVNAVTAKRGQLEPNMIRINAWNGFLERPVMEIAAIPAMLGHAQAVLDALKWKYQPAPDTPGMIAARVIAMIINEAYFGLGDEISTKQEIDIAMKLGTNYPFGPFEWSERIGLKKVHQLLTALADDDTRYSIAPALEKEYAEIN